MKTKLKGMTANPRGGVEVEIETVDDGKVELTTATRDSVGSDADPRRAEKSVRDELRKSYPSRIKSEFHVHKNRDGSFAYAVGAEPDTWPEDEERL